MARFLRLLCSHLLYLPLMETAMNSKNPFVQPSLALPGPSRTHAGKNRVSLWAQAWSEHLRNDIEVASLAKAVPALSLEITEADEETAASKRFTPVARKE